MDRKYRQRGYQDSPRENNREGGKRPPPRENLGGPRPLAMPDRRTVVRCAACGTVLPASVDLTGQCPKCNAELHSCTQCAFFDPGLRFQCSRPVTAAIARKNARNECTFYETRRTVERETTSSSPSGFRGMDPRAAFENLFKK